MRHGNYAAAKAAYEEALRIERQIGRPYGASLSLTNLSSLSHHLGDDRAAEEYARQALSLGEELGVRDLQAWATTSLGRALAGLGHLAEATRAYEQALDLRRQLDQPVLAAEPLAGLARVFLAQGELVQAQARVEEILHHLEGGTLDGTDEPFLVYLSCYRVLRASGDTRAQEVLRTAHCLLQERAARIGDQETRCSFLQNVAAHREIVEEYERANIGTNR